MEKLCKTMKHSAMSRTIVKQLSGCSLTKQGSGRNLTKQNSGRDLSAIALQAAGRSHEMQKQLSGQNILLQKQLSASHLSCQLSFNSINGDLATAVSSGRLTPPRMPSKCSLVETKHQISREAQAAGNGGAPGQGISRQISNSALGNCLMALQVNDANLEWILNDTKTICSGD
jgi:hypothetical protein